MILEKNAGEYAAIIYGNIICGGWIDTNLMSYDLFRLEVGKSAIVTDFREL